MSQDCKDCTEQLKFIASTEEAQRRYDICKACEKFEPVLARCTSCGCFMKVKVKLGKSECPLNKW
jgi:hypothetical protein